MKTTTAATDEDGSGDSDDDKPLSSRLAESLAEMPNRPAPEHRAASSAMTASDDVDARMDDSKGMDEPLESLPGPVAGSKPKENAAAQKRAVVASSSEVSSAAALTSKQGGGSKQGGDSKQGGGSSKQGSGNGTANGNLKTAADVDTKPPLGSKRQTPPPAASSLSPTAESASISEAGRLPPPYPETVAGVAAALLDLEEDIPTETVSSFFNNNLRKWRAEVSNTANFKGFGEKLRRLRIGMLEERTARIAGEKTTVALVSPEMCKGGAVHKTWMSSTHSAATPGQLLELIDILGEHMRGAHANDFRERRYGAMQERSDEDTKAAAKAKAKVAEKSKVNARANEDGRAYDVDGGSYAEVEDVVEADDDEVLSAAESDREQDSPLKKAKARGAPNGSSPRSGQAGAKRSRAESRALVQSASESTAGKGTSAVASNSSGSGNGGGVSSTRDGSDGEARGAEVSKGNNKKLASLVAETIDLASEDSNDSDSDLLVDDSTANGAGGGRGGEGIGRRRLIKTTTLLEGDSSISSSQQQQHRPPRVLEGVDPPWNTLEGVRSTIGRRVRLYWGGDRKWYKGRITQINEKKHTVFIRYDDGDTKWHPMWTERFEWIDSRSEGGVAGGGASSIRLSPSDDDDDGQLAARRARLRLKRKQASGRAPVSQSKPLGSAQARRPLSSSAPSKQPILTKQPQQQQQQQQRQRQRAANLEKFGRRMPGAAPSTAESPLASRQATVQGSSQAESELGASQGGASLGGESGPRNQIELNPDGFRVRASDMSSVPHGVQADRDLCICQENEQVPLEERKKCEDQGCISYDYFDRVFNDDINGRVQVLNINDGVMQPDPRDYDGQPILSVFSGARKHRKDGRIEVLLKYFINADDVHQAPLWEETALGLANSARFPKAPQNLLYRLQRKGIEEKGWFKEWDQAYAVVGKCKIVQVPTAQLLRLCKRALDAGKTGVYYYDSCVQVPGEGDGEGDEKFSAPMQLAGSAAPEGASPTPRGAGRGGGGGGVQVIDVAGSDESESELQPLSRRVAGLGKRRAALGSGGKKKRAKEQVGGGGGGYRIKKRSALGNGRPAFGDALGLDFQLSDVCQAIEPPHSSRADRSGRGAPRLEPHEPICSECGQEAGQAGSLLTCHGACFRHFHLPCAGIADAFQQSMLQGSMTAKALKWECNQCRVGKATCWACKGEGYVNNEADGLVRCAKPGCGRAYHRHCIDMSGEGGLELLGGVESFECPVHECALCSQPEVSDLHASRSMARRRLVICWCCPKAFCDRGSCKPREAKKLGGHFIVCKPNNPGHSRAYEPGGGYMAVSRRSVLDEARAGGRFEELTLPERGDGHAGPFYEAGVGIGCLEMQARDARLLLLHSREEKDAQVAGEEMGGGDASSAADRVDRDGGVERAAKAAAAIGGVPCGDTDAVSWPDAAMDAVLWPEGFGSAALQALPSSEATAARMLSDADKASMQSASAAIQSGQIPWGLKSVPTYLRSSSTTAAMGSLTLRARPRVSKSGVTSGTQAMQAIASEIRAKGGTDPIDDDHQLGEAADAPPTHQGALRVRVLPQVEESYYVGRFYPMLLTREGFSEFYREDTGNEWTGPLPLSNPDLGRPVERPRLTAKLRTHVLDKASGESSAVGRLIARGLAIDPRQVDYGGEDVWTVGNNRAECSGRDVGRMQQLIRDGQPVPHASKLRSAIRTVLNGMAINRVKFTTFSRHYTSARVLRAIADTVQKHVLPGDTYVDFACGNNSFGALLKDPHTNQPLPSVAFDLLSPAERTEGFLRRPWASVDATTLPQGELIIGLNPPFGHENKEAIKFVQHSLCARPRLLVLIMPATNYAPPGYTLVVHDDQLCRGSVFYAPGANASNWINASATAPGFFLYRRNDPPGCLGPIHARVGRCEHVMEHLASTRTFKRKRHQRQEAMRVASRLLQPKLTPLETVGPAADKARAIAGPGQTRMLRLALGEEVLGS